VLILVVGIYHYRQPGDNELGGGGAKKPGLSGPGFSCSRECPQLCRCSMSPSIPAIVVAAYDQAMLPTAVAISEPELRVSVAVDKSPVAPVDCSEPIVSIAAVSVPGVPSIGAVILVSSAVIPVCCVSRGTRCESEPCQHTNR
jgi:hypothetical protein